MSGPAFCVDGVLDALAVQPRRSSGDGRAILLVAARHTEGATAAACAVAQSAGPGAVYAIDLDLKRNAMARELSQVEPLGPKIDGRLSGVPFYGLRGAHNSPAPETQLAFSLHRLGRSRLYAGIFDARVVAKGVRVVVSSGSEYWDAARAGGATVVLDAPALDRSHIALRVARHMDGVVLVVGAEPGDAPAAIAAKAALDDAGANVMGLVYAGVTAPLMAIERLMRQAG